MPALPQLLRSTFSLLIVVFTLAGCVTDDRRLTDDELSCQSLGHSPNSPDFNLCMKDLNDRRCATINNKAGSRHSATLDCTRL
jgi:hypothetical protein